MKIQYLPKDLKPLFWEYDLQTLDPCKHASIIISRILEKGRIEDLKQLFKMYKPAFILKNIQTNHNISKSTILFWQSLLHT